VSRKPLRMTRRAKIGISAAFLALPGAAFIVLFLLLQHGFSAREQPMAVEAFVACRLRRLAIPRNAREARNPIPETPEILAEARAH
jgi:hypothetical protein